MDFLLVFLPLLLFIFIFAGGGFYLTCIGVHSAFYQISPLVAILPSIFLAWIFHNNKEEKKIDAFLNGVRNKDIVIMCIIFSLTGIFTELTKSIGCIEVIVNLFLSLIDSKFIIIGIFFISASISLVIGTSMGTIATVGPIAFSLSNYGFDPEICMGSLISGAMFGDNLSIISDTTIASVISQKADAKLKLKLNAKIACITSIITVIIFIYSDNYSYNKIPYNFKHYDIFLITPYVLLMTLALYGFDVFSVLSISIIYSVFLAFFYSCFSILKISKSIADGLYSMYGITLLSLMIGGMTGLIRYRSEKITNYLSIIVKNKSQVFAQLLIAKIVSIFDILLANNTIAIIFSGDFARKISEKYKIPSHYTATWLDTFSCVFQGIIPYGAQILLASVIANNLSPIYICAKVYYCYILGVVALLHIIFKKIP